MTDCEKQKKHSDNVIFKDKAIMIRKLSGIVFSFLFVLGCAICCYAQQGQPPKNSTAPSASPESPVQSGSFSKSEVNGYVCMLRSSFLYDGSSNRYLQRQRFELELTKGQRRWNWICKNNDTSQPGLYSCEGKRSSSDKMEVLPSFDFQWDTAAYNQMVCEEFVKHVD